MADPSSYLQSLNMVKREIRSLNLTGVRTTEVEIRKFPWDDRIIHKGVTISWDQPKLSDMHYDATNARDMILYPCIVTVVKGTSKGWDADMESVAKNAQTIFRWFSRQRKELLPGASEVNHVTCTSHYGKTTLPDKWKKNYDALQVIVWVANLEPRT
jgi:hypothetical protein